MATRIARIMLVMLVAEKATAAADPWLKFGDCTRSVDPGAEDERGRLTPFVCVRGRAGAEVTNVSGAPRENFWIRHADGAASVHAGAFVAAMARGRLVHVLPLNGGAERVGLPKAEVRKTQETDYAVVQLGNPALHRFWLVAGKQFLPFGLNLSEAMRSYQDFGDQRYWRTPEHAAALSMDNQRTFRVDFGYGSNEIVKTKKERPDGTPELAIHAASVRAMVDFSALDGSRLVFSGYGENRGQRRFGLGFLTTSRKGDTTQFEFARLLTTPGGEDEPFRQILRLGYGGAFRNETRWIVQFDDERLRMRMGMIGYDFRLFAHAILRFAVMHYKSEAGDDYRRWFVTSGLEAQL